MTIKEAIDILEKELRCRNKLIDMSLFYISVTEKIERTCGEAIHAENEEAAIKEVERRINENRLNGEMHLLSREVSYSVDYEN